MNSAGLLLTHLENNQLRSFHTHQVAWIAATNFFLAFSVPVFTGPIYDRQGPRSLLYVGTLCHATGLFVMSIFETDYLPDNTFAAFMFTWGLLCGLGTGAICTAITGSYITLSRHCGLAYGLVFTGCSVCGVVWPIHLRETMERWGWTFALRILCCSV